MSFDRVAPYYRRLETLVFGPQLQRARVEFVRAIASPRRALIVGEGDGRFLAKFTRAHPDTQVDCLEASGRMIELARARLPAGARVQFIHAKIQEKKLAPAFYDLLVTHFIFDCFQKETLAAVVAHLAKAATPQARWLVADFSEPARGWRRFRARALIAIMYRFFGLAAGIEARSLVDYRPFLQAHNFVLEREACSPNEMIRSELWQHEVRRTAP
ncbi:MAG: class I SAM-dependent methyltransferase [Spartobacteria bacterium]